MTQQMIAYRGLTKPEYQAIKAELKGVVSNLTFSYNKVYGTIRIAPNKRRDYNWTMADCLKILEALKKLGMFTLRQERELNGLLEYNPPSTSKVTNQVFGMVYRLV